MKEKTDPHRFWQDLEQKVDGISGGKRQLKKLRTKMTETNSQGKEVFYLKEGPSYQKALEMVSADVEFLSCLEKLKNVDERRKFKAKEFWYSILEETGLDKEDGLTFDPLNLRILSNKSNNQKNSNSYQLSLDGYKDLITAALLNPLTASRMTNDPLLSFSEIKHMAKAITDGDFKPRLRKMIEEWIEDPTLARETKPVLIDENLPEWLIEIATKLGQRKKWNLK